MFGTTLPVLIVSLAVSQVLKTEASEDGRRHDLLTPSTFGFQAEVHLAAPADGGLEQVTAFTTGTTTTTQSSTSATSRSVTDALFSLLTSACSVSAKVLFTSGTSMDGYLPLPVTSRGTNFVVSSWNSGTSFIAIRCGSQSATVTVSVPSGAPGSTTVTVSGSTLTPGGTTSVTVQADQELLVTSSGHALDGVVVSSTQPISVWAGNKDGNVLGIGQTTTLVEMFPPSDYFSTTYIVQIPTGVVLSILKVIALTSGTTVTQTASGNTVTSNTLSAAGDVWTISQVGTVHLLATAPVLVVQYIPAAGGSNYAAMSLLLPTVKWLTTYLVYGLNSVTTGSQVVCVAILTAQVSQLTATRLSDGTDLTSQMTFTSFTGTDYSSATLSLSDSSVVQLKTTDGATSFQVVQYGGVAGTDGAYAFPSGALVTCSDSSSTNDNTGSSGSSRIVTFLPNAALFVLMAVIATGVLAAAAEAIRRWKMASNGTSMDKSQTKSFVKGPTPSEEYNSYHSDQKSPRKPSRTMIGNSTVPIDEKFTLEDAPPLPHHFRSKPPTDSAYIQVKPYIPR